MRYSTTILSSVLFTAVAVSSLAIGAADVNTLVSRGVYGLLDSDGREEYCHRNYSTCGHCLEHFDLCKYHPN